MKTISSSLATMLGSPQMTLATCFKATRRDATVFGFTDHDRDLTIDGVVYEAATAQTRSALHNTETLAVDNMTLDAALVSDRITDDDLRAGAWDGCEVLIFLVNWVTPTDGIVILKRPTIGQVSIGAPGYSAELRGLSQRAQQQVVELFSPGCRADLGDARCTVDLTALTQTGSVTTAVPDRTHFVDSTRTEADGYWLGGRVNWVSGANIGRQMEVGNSTADGSIELYLPMGYEIQVGDLYSIKPGCDKFFATCRDKFHNGVNFRGEYLLPGTNQIMLYPNAK